MHPSTSAALPRASDSAALPRGGQSSVPARFHYQLPPGAYFGGEGALSAAAVPHTAAQFGGTGTLAAVLVALAAAGFAGEGTLKIPTDEADALFAGEGALAANAIPATAAIFTGEGMLGAATAGRTAAAFAGLGALGAAVTPAAAAAFSGAGALSATASIFSAMGMDKNGTQALPSNATTKVTAWSTRSGFPATVINDNDLLVNGAGAVDITATAITAGTRESMRVASPPIGSTAKPTSTAGRATSGRHHALPGPVRAMWYSRPSASTGCLGSRW